MFLFKRKDLRKIGTGNVTSTAVIIHAGKLPGTLSLLGEMFKTFLCLFIAYLLVDLLWAYLLMVVSAATGEIWSVFLKGAGGRGQTIFTTGFLILCPVPFLIAALFFIFSFLITRDLHRSNQLFHFITPFTLTFAIFYNPALFGPGQNSWGYVIVGLAFSVLFFLKHRAENDDILQAQAAETYGQ